MFRREGPIIVAKFIDGDILKNLRHLMKELRAESAIIVGGIGMLERTRIGYFDGAQYIEETIEEPAELISLQGNIGMHENDHVIHAHAALAGLAVGVMLSRNGDRYAAAGARAV